MIHVSNISKTFRVHHKEAGLKNSVKALFHRNWSEKTALDKVSLDIGPNEIVGLVGANGAGKTTLVKILSGIIHPTAGEAKILGHTPWERQHDFRRQISLIMGQKASLWWDLPAADCFLLLKEIYQIPAPQFKSTLENLTEILGVEKQINIQIRRLSLGERMKMELIAALLHRPKVIFLDEPTIGLDIRAQKAIRNFILSYQKEYHPAMILTSHYMEDIETLCKKIIVIKDGRLVYNGPLNKILDKYSQHKILSIKLKDEIDMASFQLPEAVGEVTYHDKDQLKIKVLKEEVGSCASYVLDKFSVADLEIEGPEISEIIGQIL